MQNRTGQTRQPYARAPAMGAAFGILIVMSSIALSAKGLGAFFSLGGLIIVVGGVIAVAFMSFQASDVHTALGAIANTGRQPRATYDVLHQDVKQIVSWGHLIKARGLREFESRSKPETDVSDAAPAHCGSRGI